MILDKIYQQQPLDIDDMRFLFISFFKIKGVKVHVQSINQFIKYLFELNEHPLIVEFHKFIPVNLIIYEMLIPTFKQHIDVMEVISKDKIIRYTFNQKKFEKLKNGF